MTAPGPEGAWVLNSERTRATLATVVSTTEDVIEVFNTEKQESQFFDHTTFLAVGDYWSQMARPKLVPIDDEEALGLVKGARKRALQHRTRGELQAFFAEPTQASFEKFASSLSKILAELLPDVEFGEQLGIQYPNEAAGAMTAKGMENWRKSFPGEAPAVPVRRLVTPWVKVHVREEGEKW